MADIDDLRIETTPAPPPRCRGIHALVLVLLAALAVMTYFALRRTTTDGNTDAGTLPTGPRMASEAPTAPRGTLTAGGYLEVIPPGPVVVTPQVEGRIQELTVIKGDTVETGQLLLVLDDTLHRQRLRQAEAAVLVAEAELARLRAGFRVEEIAEAEARLAAAEALQEQAAQEQARSRALAGTGALPGRRLEQAQAGLESARAESDAARARLALLRSGARPEDIALAEARLTSARTTLAQADWAVAACLITAPADGVVLEQFVRVGDWIGPAQERGALSAAAAGGAVMTLFNPRQLQVWVEVNQRDAGQVFTGQRVTLRADALRDQLIEGHVSRIMPGANLQRNTVEVKVTFSAADGPPEALRPEMSVQVTFLPRDPSINHVPEEAMNDE